MSLSKELRTADPDLLCAEVDTIGFRADSHGTQPLSEEETFAIVDGGQAAQTYPAMLRLLMRMRERYVESGDSGADIDRRIEGATLAVLSLIRYAEGQDLKATLE
jgi:hypothetical protein